jgi:hypothetical protein
MAKWFSKSICIGEPNPFTRSWSHGDWHALLNPALSAAPTPPFTGAGKVPKITNWHCVEKRLFGGFGRKVAQRL